MTSTSDDPLSSPRPTETGTGSPHVLPKIRGSGFQSPLTSPFSNLSYGRANASLSNLFTSTSSLTLVPSSHSGTSTPTLGTIEGSVFSPGTPQTGARASSPSQLNLADDATSLILRAFAPHISVLASPDCEELLRHKGIHGGLLELLRPFGERIEGRVVVRDSTGASKPWDDFGVRFTGVRDGLEAPHLPEKTGSDNAGSEKEAISALHEYRPPRLRSGGDTMQVDELVDRHVQFAEIHLSAQQTDYLNVKQQTAANSALSPFYNLYLRRMLSGLVLSPHETFSHPVTLLIAISSRNPSPIEELRTLYASSNTGENRLPNWVNNEYLRYYVLVHDEDYDDIKKSTTLYEQMKRHFGLHCHLLRLRSTQCLPTDDGSMRLPTSEWMSAAEELTEIAARENIEDDEDPTPYIFESDAASVRSFVRELVTQSIIPGMERMTATWNDQVASRRRGLSGRFMSLSKRFTGFSGRSVTSPTATGGSNYDTTQGYYRPDSPEAIMRKLADYALMLRDFKLAQSTYDLLATDFKNDKAWKYYAGASEMSAITTLLSTSSLTSKLRIGTVDQALENAYYSYTSRCGAPFYAHRALALGAELLRSRGGSALDDAARWLSRIMDDHVLGPTGHALTMERIAACYSARQGVGTLESGSRSRKAAFWTVLAAAAWAEQNKPARAERDLLRAVELYGVSDDGVGGVAFEGMTAHIDALRAEIERLKPDSGDCGSGPQRDAEMEKAPLVVTEQVDQRTHRRSVSVANTMGFDPLGAVQVPRSPGLERKEADADGFE